MKESEVKGPNRFFSEALVEAKEKYAEWKKARESKAEQDLQKLSKKPAPFKHVKVTLKIKKKHYSIICGAFSHFESSLFSVYFKVNKCTTAQRVVIDPSDMPICECSAEQGTVCGPDSNCLNRMLQFECTTKCPAQEKCMNQRFSKREYADLEPYRALNRGWGLKTKQGIVCILNVQVPTCLLKLTCLNFGVSLLKFLIFNAALHC